MRDPRTPDDFAEAWTLDRDVCFLNHGSFGACPRAGLQAQSDLRAQMEAQPLRFFLREQLDLLDEARERICEFAGAQSQDLVAIPNATTGVNAVMQSYPFEQGDELLTTNHVYGACLHAARHAVERAGGSVVIADVPFPVGSADEITEAILSRVTERTRFALLDHVTSPTALVFPLERLVPELQERGIDVMVDGAHVVGMLPLDLDRLGAAYYTSNLHKWCCAPKGAAFLHVRRDKQKGLFPTVISHGYAARREGRPWLQDLFDWPGTTDPTPFLAAPAAMSDVCSSSRAILRSLMPVRVRIQSSDVSTIVSSSAFVSTREGRYEPVPVMETFLVWRGIWFIALHPSWRHPRLYGRSDGYARIHWPHEWRGRSPSRTTRRA